MKTMINIKADREVKVEAQKLAKELGLSLSAIINAYLKQFNRTKEVHFSVDGELRAAAKKKLNRLHDDVKRGRNLSKRFSGVEDAIRYLRS